MIIQHFVNIFILNTYEKIVLYILCILHIFELLLNKLMTCEKPINQKPS